MKCLLFTVFLFCHFHGNSADDPEINMNVVGIRVRISIKYQDIIIINNVMGTEYVVNVNAS